jgi:hypothetical protein
MLVYFGLWVFDYCCQVFTKYFLNCVSYSYINTTLNYFQLFAKDAIEKASVSQFLVVPSLYS